MSYFKQSCLLVACLFAVPLSADTLGDDKDNRLVGSVGFDLFYGGAGADTFVIDELEDNPDWIVDLDPTEGDLIEVQIDALRPSLSSLKSDHFKLSRRGLLTVRIEDKHVPLVDLGRGDLRLEVDTKKGRCLLKFEQKF